MGTPDQLFYEAVRELRKREQVEQGDYEEEAKTILNKLGQEPIPEDIEVITGILRDLFKRSFNWY